MEGSLEEMKASLVGLSSSEGQAGKAMEHDRGYVNNQSDPNKIAQSGISNNITDMTTMLRSEGRIDRGKMPVLQSPAAAPRSTFSDHHLKQMRAQCLVYLAFRNKLMPKKLHLDIALGNFIPSQDGSSKDLKAEEQSIDHDSNSAPEAAKSFGKLDLD